MRMRAGLIFGVLGLLGASPARADVPIPLESVYDPVLPHEVPGNRPGVCTIKYYNLCSGWFWLWSAGVAGDEDGVVFDFPAECSTIPGEECVNTGFWWYWRYTHPGYGYTVTYRMYDVDGAFCKAGSPLGEFCGEDPVERWNHYSGLGASLGERVAITASWDVGAIPFLVTDAPAKNEQVECAEASPIAHSFWYGGPGYPLCPPSAFEDQAGPCNILMDATFSCEETAIEPASWGAIKTLFR